MKIQRRGLFGLLTLLCFTAGSVGAGTLTKGQTSKYYGVYTGEVTGIAGVSGGISRSVSFVTTVTISQRSRLFAPVQISGLHTASAHLLVIRKPTGTERRATFVGYYTGTTVNPLTMLEEPVSGVRTMSIRDRGAGRKPRYVMRFSDDLREGSYSAQDIEGTLVKVR